MKFSVKLYDSHVAMTAIPSHRESVMPISIKAMKTPVQALEECSDMEKCIGGVLMLSGSEA